MNAHEPKWRIEPYKDLRGQKPVEEFIRSLPKKDAAKVFWTIDLLENAGTISGLPYSKFLRGELWKL